LGRGSVTWESSKDLAALVVPQVRSSCRTDDPWEPYRLVDVDGVVVAPVATYLRDLQAAGRSAATARSYCLDLLRWFRFLWAINVDPPRHERTGLYRPTVPSRVPRSVPDDEFNEIFARLGSHRDRALVAFYVSTGARASELLSATQGGVDPGRGLIAVVRKGQPRDPGAPGVDRRVRLAAAPPG
jgi:site-specific recombinase XerD